MVLRFENPFASKTGETDVTINTEQETLYLHSRILSIYSPKFKEIFFNQHGDDVPLTFHGDSAQDVILFFKMFYPEHKLKIIHGKNLILAAPQQECGSRINSVIRYLWSHPATRKFYTIRYLCCHPPENTPQSFPLPMFITSYDMVV